MEIKEFPFTYKVGYRLVVSQIEITEVFTVLDIFRTASPSSRVQINTAEFGIQSS